MKPIVCAAIALAVAGTAAAQTPGPVQDRTFTNAAKSQWDSIKEYVVKAAEQMPEADYAFKPTPKVRSFGELVAHVSDANYGFCGMAGADKGQTFGNAEKTKTAKSDIVAALKASVEYCDKTFAAMNDGIGREPGNLMGQPAPRLFILAFNNNHIWEHYGNMVTYFRLKDLVPPSSQRGGM